MCYKSDTRSKELFKVKELLLDWGWLVIWADGEEDGIQVASSGSRIGLVTTEMSGRENVPHRENRVSKGTQFKSVPCLGEEESPI